MSALSWRSGECGTCFVRHVNGLEECGLWVAILELTEPLLADWIAGLKVWPQQVILKGKIRHKLRRIVYTMWYIWKGRRTIEFEGAWPDVGRVIGKIQRDVEGYISHKKQTKMKSRMKAPNPKPPAQWQRPYSHIVKA